jgi:16S rRNA (adenine1518-N6/adenine1519-N6)-dimethyltransferase
MPSADNPKASLNKYGLAPSKKRGQNFLVNPGTAERIVALGNYDSRECVVEVGVGFGALTRKLAPQVRRVIGIELDSGIIRYHESENDLPKNVTLVHGDILKIDFSALAENTGAPLKILANLPYSISNPFIFKLIENSTYVHSVIVMLQKEVSDRLCAQPATKAYGIPTVLLGSFACVKKHMLIKPVEFHPRPKIISEVIEILFTGRDIGCSLENYQRIVRASFAGRRKTMQNNLSSPSLFPFVSAQEKSLIKRFVLKILEDSDIDPQVRAERLSSQQFETITSCYEAFIAALQ